MEPILAYNKERAVSILAAAFKEVPGALWVIKKDGRKWKRLENLCRFCVQVSMNKRGAFISSDGKGVALLFPSKARQSLLSWLREYLLMAHCCVGWERVWSISKREQNIRRRRYQDPHLYFWMLGVEDHTNGLNTAIEMRDFTFAISRELQLPLVAETTCKRNVALYKRFGFRIYDEWKTGEQDITVWFMIREAK